MNANPTVSAQHKFEKLFSFFISKADRDGGTVSHANPDTAFFKNPFHEVCDPELFYAGGQHERIYQSLRQFISDQLSLAAVTGPVGLGKTMLARTLTNHLDPQHFAVSHIISLSKMTPMAFLKAVLHGVGYRIEIVEKRFATADLFKVLQDYCEQLRAGHRRLIVIVDEAHLLSPEALKIIKSITCIESMDQKLASCILFGELSLDSRMEYEGFASLKSRVYVHEHLSTLCEGEVRQYVSHRLRAAGFSAQLFNEAELTGLVNSGQGNCREINKQAFALFRTKSHDELLRSYREY